MADGAEGIVLLHTKEKETRTYHCVMLVVLIWVKKHKAADE